LQIDPDNLVVLKFLAEDAAARQDWSTATGLLERVVLLDPSDEPADAELAQLRSQKADLLAPDAEDVGDQTAAVLSPAADAIDASDDAEVIRPDSTDIADDLADPLPAASTEDFSTPPAPTRAPGPTVPAEDDDALSFETSAEPADLDAETPAATKGRASHTLATKTLAEIYLSQGYREKALDVLKQILARHPDRQDVRAKIDELEAQVGAKAPPPPEPEPEPAAAAATEGADPPHKADRKHFESWLEKISRKQQDPS
jgi:hypothetical protein